MFVHCSNSSPKFSRRHTKRHADTNRRHSERDCHRSTTTQLWNADMSTSSNHTKAFVQYCHGKHTVTSSRTLLSDHICPAERPEYVRSETFISTASSIFCLHSEDPFCTLKQNVPFLYPKKRGSRNLSKRLFLLQTISTDYWTHPYSCSVANGHFSIGVMWPERWDGYVLDATD